MSLKSHIMHKLLLILSLLMMVASVQAKEYGMYDPKLILTVTNTSTGKKYGLDVAYLDRMLKDLALHAKNYPVQFDTPVDRQRATQDAKAISGMLGTLMTGTVPNPELLSRAGLANIIAHNLDIPGAAEKADAIYQQIFTLEPSNPQANYIYGTFLASVGNSKEALVYLDKALSAGVVDASYTLGMAQLTLGNKKKALDNLEFYKRHNPNNRDTDKIIEAIKNGKIEVRTK